MENEKLENQKIDENKKEDVAGGYGTGFFPFPDGSLLLEKLELNDDEYNKINKKGYVKHMEAAGENDEYISKVELKNLEKNIRRYNEWLRRTDREDKIENYEMFLQAK